MNRRYRKTVIAGNWKMNKTPGETKQFAEEFKAKLPESVRVREKLITAPMVEKYGKEGYRNMVVPADATVTPLAAETADALKMGIQKKL